MHLSVRPNFLTKTSRNWFRFEPVVFFSMANSLNNAFTALTLVVQG